MCCASRTKCRGDFRQVLRETEDNGSSRFALIVNCPGLSRLLKAQRMITAGGAGVTLPSNGAQLMSIHHPKLPFHSIRYSRSHSPRLDRTSSRPRDQRLEGSEKLFDRKRGKTARSSARKSRQPCCAPPTLRWPTRHGFVIFLSSKN